MRGKYNLIVHGPIIRVFTVLWQEAGGEMRVIFDAVRKSIEHKWKRWWGKTTDKTHNY